MYVLTYVEQFHQSSINRLDPFILIIIDQVSTYILYVHKYCTYILK